MNLFQPAHLEAVCPSCRSTHSQKWVSEWWKHDHYKTLICDCGYKVSLKTDGHHSGHHEHHPLLLDFTAPKAVADNGQKQVAKK